MKTPTAHDHASWWLLGGRRGSSNEGRHGGVVSPFVSRASQNEAEWRLMGEMGEVEWESETVWGQVVTRKSLIINVISSQVP